MKTFHLKTQSGRKYIIQDELNTMYKSIKYLEKVQKSIQSCTRIGQLKCLRPFVQNYWNNMHFVGLQGFVAIELMDMYEKKEEELMELWHETSDKSRG